MTIRNSRHISLIVFLASSSLLTGMILLSIFAGEKYPQLVREPNLIIISSDTLRADHLGAYGYERDTSPRIDAFVRNRAVVLEQAIAPSPYTIASEASLLASQYPARHGAIARDTKEGLQLGTLKPEAVTLAEVLQGKGYDTAAFVSQGELSADSGIDQGFDRYTIKGGSLSTILPESLEWIDNRNENPFFLFTQAYDTHAPYHAPGSYEHMFDGEYDGALADHEQFPLSYSEIDEEAPLRWLVKDGDGAVLRIPGEDPLPLSQRDLDHVIAHYDEQVRFVDDAVGSFLDALEEKGLLENTIVVFLASHGETLADDMDRPGGAFLRLFGHGHVRDELVRVPVILHVPRVSASRVAKQVELVDLYPTLLDLMRIPLPSLAKDAVQGESFASLLFGDSEGGGEYAFGELPLVMEFVRTPEWKLIRNASGYSELYNIREDPGERNNVLQKYSQVAERLQQILKEWRSNQKQEKESDGS